MAVVIIAVVTDADGRGGAVAEDEAEGQVRVNAVD